MVTRVLAFVTAIWLAASASAQPVSPADLRREIEMLQAENQRLATQVQALTARVAEAEAERDVFRERAAESEREIARLRAAGGAETGPTGARAHPEPDRPGPLNPAEASIPADPLASPASLLAELQRRYEADLAGLIETPGPGDRLTPSQRRVLVDWCSAQAREIRGSVEWRVRLRDLRTSGRQERSVMLRVVDPETGRPIGEAIEVAVPRAFGDRVARELAAPGVGPEHSWTLTGTLAAAPRVNPERPTRGVFNHPLLVGPYVELGFELDWKSLSAVQAPAEAAADPTAGARP